MVKQIKSTDATKSKKSAKVAAKKFVNPLDPYLKGKKAPGYVVLDGGIGSELQFFRDVNLFAVKSDLWDANAIISAPHVIKQIHLDYYSVGADIATTATYSAHLDGFQSLGMTEKQAYKYMQKAVKLAKSASLKIYKDKLRKNPKAQVLKGLVAASNGYTGTKKSEGICYSGDYSKISQKEVIDYHQWKLGALDKSEADLILFESLPNIKEAQALKKLIPKMEKPCFVCFVCKNGREISSGESIREAVKLV